MIDLNEKIIQKKSGYVNVNEKSYVASNILQTTFPRHRVSPIFPENLLGALDMRPRFRRFYVSELEDYFNLKFLHTF